MVTIKAKRIKQVQRGSFRVASQVTFGLAITSFLPEAFMITVVFFFRFYTLSIENSGFYLILELGTKNFVIYCLSDVYPSFKCLTKRKKGENGELVNSLERRRRQGKKAQVTDWVAPFFFFYSNS